MKIDIADAIDRLRCMASEIIPVGDSNPILNESQIKDIKLLMCLVEVLRGFKWLSK